MEKEEVQQCAIPAVSGSCFWGHKWSKWTQYKQELIYNKTGRITYEIRQRKTCLRCGKMQDEWVA